MRYVCEECGEAYDDKAPAASLATSALPIAARHSQGMQRPVHRCRTAEDREDGSLFDVRGASES